MRKAFLSPAAPVALLAWLALLALEGCSSDPGVGPSGTAGTGGLGGGGGNAGGAGNVGGAGGGGTSGTGGTAGTPLPGVVVDTASGQLATDMADGRCDILEAAAAAASGQSVRECANPSGSKVIVLTAGRSYPTKKTLRLVDGVSIATNGVGSATIAAAPGWITAANDPTTGCLVHAASSTGTIKIDDVTLSQIHR